MLNKQSIYRLFMSLMVVGLIAVGSSRVHAEYTPVPDETENWADDTDDFRKKAEPEKSAGEESEIIPFQIPYDQNIPTKRVVVSSFDVAVEGLSAGVNAEKGLKAQLITTLSKFKNFIVLDRDTLPDLRSELTLRESRSVTRESAVTPGQLLGAQVVIKGVITEFSEEAKSKSSDTNISLGRLAGALKIFGSSKALDVIEAVDPSIGKGKETVTGKVGLDIRLVEINTGKVIQSMAVRREITRKSSSRSLGIAGFSTDSAEFENTVIGLATRLVIEEAVLKIFEAMKRVPWQGMVAAVTPDGKVIINAGYEHNIRAGQVMSVVYEGQKVTDPATGLLLYSEKKKVAEIRVTSVKDRFSFAEVLTGGEIQRGDIVTLLRH